MCVIIRAILQISAKTQIISKTNKTLHYHLAVMIVLWSMQLLYQFSDPQGISISSQYSCSKIASTQTTQIEFKLLIKCLPCSKRWCPDRLQFGAPRVDYVNCHIGIGVKSSHVIQQSVSDQIKMKKDVHLYHILLKYLS